MPVRIVCPSCSAALSVKDEYAGRAVKCPKCGGVIPPAQPAPVPPAATPAPPPFEEVDQPAPAKAAPRTEGDDPDRPARRRRDDERDEDDRDRPRRARRDDDRDDRPARRRRDDDGPPQKSGGGTGKVLAILAVVGLLCCGGVGFGVYWFVVKVKEKVEQVKGELERWNPAVTRANYDALKVGTTTRADAELTFGPGRAATTDDTQKLFAGDPQTRESWNKKVAENRALIWNNGDDHILAAFHPDADPDSRLQKKHWQPKSGPGASSGLGDDKDFLESYPAGAGPAIDVTAENLAREYKDDRAAADAKYKDKTVRVEGKLHDIMFMSDGTIYVNFQWNAPGDRGLGTIIRCVVQKKDDVNKVLRDVSRGQTIRCKGRCAGYLSPFIDVMNATVEATGKDPSVQISATALLAEHAKNPKAADAKYEDKQMTITGAYFDSKEDQTTVLLVGSPKKAATTKIKVTVSSEARAQLANLKPSTPIKVKGEYSSSGEGTINLNRAWIVP